MIGKLIVVDGLDASGKHTQTDLLAKKLNDIGKNVMKITFPNYEDSSSSLVKSYLAGEFGDKATDVNAYAASSFYAVDRYASYIKFWKDFLNSGGIVIADRYTTSNAIHQCAKLKDEDKPGFFSWLYDYEFNLLGIPKPDLVIFLNMPPKYAGLLLQKRYNDDESKKDLHEKDINHLASAYDCALKAALFYKWEQISCVKDDKIKMIEDINEELFEKVLKII